jgi:hypothetical protein
LVRPAGTISGQQVLLAFGGASANSSNAVYNTAAVWSSTLDLLCEYKGAVCFGHGVCQGIVTAGNPHILTGSQFVPGASCKCDTGWLAPSCNVTECGDHNCKHGTCSARSEQGSHCICDGGWGGASCSLPVCIGGCLHGLCASPGTCVCSVGWTGDTCRVKANWLQDIGQWIASHLGTAYVLTCSVGLLVVILHAVVANCIVLGAKQPVSVRTSAQGQDNGVCHDGETDAASSLLGRFRQTDALHDSSASTGTQYGTSGGNSFMGNPKQLHPAERLQPFLSDVCSISSTDEVTSTHANPHTSLAASHLQASQTTAPLGDMDFY